MVYDTEISSVEADLIRNYHDPLESCSLCGHLFNYSQLQIINDGKEELLVCDSCYEKHLVNNTT